MNERTFDPKKFAKLENPERKARLPESAIVAAARLFPGIRVADVGSGTGYFSLPLLAAGERVTVTAIDVSEEMNAFFLEKLGKTPWVGQVALRVGTGEQLPIGDGSIDLVVMGNVFHEFDDSKKALKEAFRVLVPGGRILVVDWAIPADTSTPPEAGPPYAHRRSDKELWSELLEAGFTDPESHPGFRDSYAVSARKRG